MSSEAMRTSMYGSNVRFGVGMAYAGRANFDDLFDDGTKTDKHRDGML